ncbi:MAG TPA: FIST N-terminal domain-containing protein, partial [Ktedonobacteraceae bacterium]|nr:FIST N-terminal domain-containing protein [Ktedonobacteraceae bacterium]
IEGRRSVTHFAIVQTDVSEGTLAGQSLGAQIRDNLSTPPDVVMVFASPRSDYAELLQALKETCQARLLLGCSSAGEFTSNIRGEGKSCAIALQADDMQFTLAVGRGLQSEPDRAAQQVVSSFQGLADTPYPYRTALVFIDALHGCVDTFVERLTRLTSGTYQFYGGGAGDNGQFLYTPVFADTEVLSDAAVVLEILSHKPIGIGAGHSWKVSSDAMRVTGSKGLRLVSLDHRPAVEAFQLYAARTLQELDLNNPLPFFLLNIVGIEVSTGYHLLRVPLAIEADGSVLCAAEVPLHSRIRFMHTTSQIVAEAPTEAVNLAERRLYACEPAFALFVDCVATRLRLGEDFGFELDAVQSALGPVPYVGFNTHGQVLRVEGQYSGFLNCTAVACIFPR